MVSTKAYLNIKIDKGVKETAARLLPTLDELLTETIRRKNIPHKTVEADEEGRILVDKDKAPELYDWAVNG